MDTGLCREWTGKISALVMSILTSVIITLLALAILAFLMLRMELSSNAENIGLICISVISCFAGGFFCGKKNRKKGFLWGLVVGALYYICILVMRMAAGEDASGDMWRYITTLLYCCGSGMLGGMLS